MLPRLLISSILCFNAWSCSVINRLKSLNFLALSAGEPLYQQGWTLTGMGGNGSYTRDRRFRICIVNELLLNSCRAIFISYFRRFYQNRLIPSSWFWLNLSSGRKNLSSYMQSLSILFKLILNKSHEKRLFINPYITTDKLHRAEPTTPKGIIRLLAYKGRLE